MISNAERADVLERALRARVDGDATVADLYTDDVTVWTPSLTASTLAELQAEFERRDDAFSDIELVVTPLDVGGDYACAEWDLAMTHSGDLPVADGATYLIERMAPAGVELLVAAHTDGVVPAVVIGLGGIWAEALDDVAIVPLPCDAGRAAAAIA